MTRDIAITILAAALVGCAHTTTGYRQQMPKIEVMSDKKPEAILGCITEAWGPLGYTKTYTPLANGGSVALYLPTVLISTGNKLGIVDAESVEGRTRVRFYGFDLVGKKGSARLIDQTKACL